MATVLLVCVVILVIAALVFGIVSLLTGEDPGLAPVEPDGRALPLPNHRSLTESDLKAVRFDVTLRGYRMAQVDRALRRTAYDVGYKDEMIAVLEAEVAALREGRVEDADMLRKAREAAASPEPTGETVEGADGAEVVEAPDAADAAVAAHTAHAADAAGDDETSAPAEAAEAPEAVEPVRDAAPDPEDLADEIAEAEADTEASAETEADLQGDETDTETETTTRTESGADPADTSALPAARSAPKKSTKRAARA
jgi:DivIVA domain-containing protein